MSDDRLALETFLPYRLNRLADAISRELSATYRRQFGITRPEWRLLATLGQYGTMTATGIGRHSAMHKTRVSRAVTALERRRWLARETDANDRRVEHLRLTRAGEDAYRKIVPAARRYEDGLMAGLTQTERAAVAAGLTALEKLEGLSGSAAAGAEPEV